jgi:PiT family inorganic phosphate transporter
MANVSATMPPAAPAATKPKLDHKMHPMMLILFVGFVAVGLLYTVYSLYSDVSETGTQVRTVLPFILLGIALLVALGFEFVNGFHDTANAVATVIYTHSLPPHFAVVWSGLWNFTGVLLSSGAVAFGILTLLPVELILQVGSDAGFAMVFALLIAAIIWNIGTWALGLPASSSHTLIGSIIGVGLANQLMAPAGSATSGVDWGQALNVGKSLLLSPVIGFTAAALLLLAMKALVKSKQLYEAPKGDQPPPFWIRGLLILTCTGVSFAHGSNDGQKGMGLIMLILIGTVPTAYALNRAMPDDQVVQFHAVAQATNQSLTPYAKGLPAPADYREGVAAYVRSHELKPETIPALVKLIEVQADQVAQYGSLSRVPVESVDNVRNDMYLTSEAIRLMQKAGNPAFDPDTGKNLTAYKKDLDGATKFIPLWVKVAVAIALGLGTMVGWRRIVVTVGEKIGKSHMTYAQGGSAELVAMVTIGAADVYGLPVSTTHVLSSGVAGTMAANKSGLQMSTVRNLLMAWVLTLPAAILLSGCLYFVFRHLF